MAIGTNIETPQTPQPESKKNPFSNWLKIGWNQESESEKREKEVKTVLNEVLSTFPLIVNDQEVKFVDNGKIRAQFFSSPEGSGENLEGIVELRFRDENNTFQRLRYQRSVIDNHAKEKLSGDINLWEPWAKILKGLVDRSKRQAQIPKTPPGPPVPL